MREDDNTSRTCPGEGGSRSGGGDRARWDTYDSRRDSYESRRIHRGSRNDFGSYYETPGVTTDPWEQYKEHGERAMSSELRGRQKPYPNRAMESDGSRPRRGPDGPGNVFYDRWRGIWIESMLSRTIGRGHTLGDNEGPELRIPLRSMRRLFRQGYQGQPP